MRLAAVFAVFALAVALSACSGRASGPKAVVIGFTPSENAETLELSGQKLATKMSALTGIEIKVFVAGSYNAAVEALRHGQVQFAWLTPFVMVQAADLCGAKPLYKVVRKGSPSYHSAIIVRADSPYKTIADLKGKSVAWADVASNSGHVIPKVAVMDAGFVPDDFFSRQIFAGGHDKVVIAVQSGQVEAGGTWTVDQAGTQSSWSRFLKEKAGEIRPVWISPPLPNDAFAVTAAYEKENPSIVKAVKKALKEIAAEPGQNVLREMFAIEDLVDTSIADFEPVRSAAKRTELWQVQP